MLLSHTEKKNTTGRRMDPGSREANLEVIENSLIKEMKPSKTRGNTEKIMGFHFKSCM